MSGILDVKWCDAVYGSKGLPIFGAADATGDITLWSLTSDEYSCSQCQLIEFVSTNDEEALALSLDWSTAVQQRSVGVSFLLQCLYTGTSL